MSRGPNRDRGLWSRGKMARRNGLGLRCSAATTCQRRGIYRQSAVGFAVALGSTWIDLRCGGFGAGTKFTGSTVS